MGSSERRNSLSVIMVEKWYARYALQFLRECTLHNFVYIQQNTFYVFLNVYNSLNADKIGFREFA